MTGLEVTGGPGPVDIGVTYGAVGCCRFQQIIPLPEAAEYQVQAREKSRKERQARQSGADFTRYDVTLGDVTFPDQWKRNAIFLVCKRLCEGHASPQEIDDLFDWRSHVWYSVDGEVGAEDFVVRAKAKADAGGPAFDHRRWFCEDEDLVRAGGATFAFSKMWGGENWRVAMTLMRDKYPMLDLAFTPTGKS